MKMVEGGAKAGVDAMKLQIVYSDKSYTQFHRVCPSLFTPVFLRRNFALASSIAPTFF